MRNFTILFLFFLFVGISYGQGKEITGTITDSETGDPVISASVIIKNTAIGASSDFDGLQRTVSLFSWFKAQLY